MKVLLISDIHNNIHALRAVDAAEAPYDMLFCVGDITDWGMDPKPVVEWMRSHKHVAVRGNHDDLLVSMEEVYANDPVPVSEQKNFLAYTFSQLDEEDMAYLRSLPQSAVVDVDGYTYYLAHTEGEEEFDTVLSAMMQNRSQKMFDELWDAHTGRPEVPSYRRRIVYGHTHQCWMHQVRGGALYLNPGSVSNRIHGEDNIEPGADYMVIQDGVVQMKHVSYPTDEIRQRIRDYGFEKVYTDIALQLFTPEELSVSEDKQKT